ncbi:MAG: VWA domain-containing protein [Phycisphaeraceae bacterium]|nr:VWA domain-containing protein [Phycisphaeraceae bacterium]
MLTKRALCRLGLVAIMMAGTVAMGAGKLEASSVTTSVMPSQPESTRPRPIGPDIVVPHRPYWHQDAIEVKGVDVDIDIVDQVATVHMAVTLFNPSRSPREAQLALPVPSDAAIRAFGIDAISEEPNAILMPRDEATKLYRDIVRRMVDPGLLEFVGTGLIQSSVFPVPAGGTQTFRVVYEHTIKAESGRVDYVLARSQSVDASRVPWKVAMRVKSSRGIGAMYSPTHDVSEERLGVNDLKLKVRNPQSAGPVRVTYVVGASDGTSATVLLYPDARVGSGQGGYFLLIVDAPDVEQAKHTKREVTLVIDRSGSMRGEKMEQAKAAAMQIIEALDDGELFNIIDYSDTISRFSSRPVEKNAESIAKMRQYVSEIRAMGGTNIHDALLEALRATPESGVLPLVLFLTDGLPTVGPTNEVVIREAASKANIHKRRIFSFGVGYDVNAPLLSGISSGSRAVATFVEPQEDVEVKVGQVFAKLHGPVLLDPVLREVRVDLAVGPGALREVLPGVLPDIFAGEQMIVVGQYNSGEKFRAAIAGSAGEEVVSIAADFVPDQASHANAFVARLWAQRKIATLIDALRQRSADPDFNQNNPAYKELVDEIVALSKEHGILTEYTAFIALESEYRQDLADKGASRQRHFAPAQQSRSGAEGVQREATNLDMLSRKQVAPASTSFYSVDAAGGRAASDPVQNIANLSLYRRSNRWVEASLLDTPDIKPARIIDFDSKEFDEVLEYLVANNQQGILALDADVLLNIKGQAVLIRRVQ